VPGTQPKVIPHRIDGDGLQDAVPADGRSQVTQIPELTPNVERVEADLGDVDPAGRHRAGHASPSAQDRGPVRRGHDNTTSATATASGPSGSDPKPDGPLRVGPAAVPTVLIGQGTRTPSRHT
jgi:hypothetical protein